MKNFRKNEFFVHNIEINDIAYGALSYLVEWYTSEKWEFIKLPITVKKSIVNNIIPRLNSYEEMGELLACSFLIKNGWKILWSNVSISTVGKAPNRGIDALTKFKDEYFITEIKTNSKTPSENNSNKLIKNVHKQLDERFLNVTNILGNIFQLMPKSKFKKIVDEKIYDAEMGEFINKTYGLGIVISEINKNVNDNPLKSQKHTIVYGKINSLKDLNYIYKKIMEQIEYEESNRTFNN